GGLLRTLLAGTLLVGGEHALGGGDLRGRATLLARLLGLGLGFGLGLLATLCLIHGVLSRAFGRLTLLVVAAGALGLPASARSRPVDDFALVYDGRASRVGNDRVAHDVNPLFSGGFCPVMRGSWGPSRA